MADSACIYGRECDGRTRDLPRLEHIYLAAYTHDTSVSSALAFFSSVGSGMMSLTGIVFAIAFVMVQFSAVAYSPRLVIMFASNPTVPYTRHLLRNIYLFSRSAQLDGSGWLRDSPIVLDAVGRHPADRQHAGILQVGAES